MMGHFSFHKRDHSVTPLCMLYVTVRQWAITVHFGLWRLDTGFTIGR